jgi:hypothetical protein
MPALTTFSTSTTIARSEPLTAVVAGQEHDVAQHLTLQGELRAGVRAAGGLAADRADVDHAALAAQQRGQERLSDGDVAEQVDLKHPPPLRHRQGFDRVVHLDAGTVDERVQCAQRARVAGDPRGECLGARPARGVPPPARLSVAESDHALVAVGLVRSHRQDFSTSTSQPGENGSKP